MTLILEHLVKSQCGSRLDVVQDKVHKKTRQNQIMTGLEAVSENRVGHVIPSEYSVRGTVGLSHSYQVKPFIVILWQKVERGKFLTMLGCPVQNQDLCRCFSFR